MAPLTFTQAVERAALLARQTLPPELHERLNCALALVKAGAVFQDDAGHWTVASASTPDKRYSVNGSCRCEDAFYQAPQGRCKHKLAQLLARKTQALLHDAVSTRDGVSPRVTTPAPASPAVPLPEAPASANCHITIAGRQVQLTLRDVDESRLLERLAVVLDQYPVLQPAVHTPGNSQGKAWCAKHQTTMHWNEGKEGRKGWYSHRVGETWCKGR